MERGNEHKAISGTSEMIGGEALIPNPGLQSLQFLVGTWQTRGTHPLVPGTTFHGRTSFAWHQGGAFLIMHSEIDEAEIPSGVAIFGSDDAAGQCFMLYFDERNISRRYDIDLGKDEITWRRDDPKLSQRFTIRADAGSDTLTGSGRMSRDGSAWEDDLQLTYARIG